MSKRICGYLCSSLIGVVAVGSVMFSISAAAGDLPLSCTTVNTRGGGYNYQVDAITGGNGEFPLTVACPDNNPNDPNDPNNKQCADFGYTVSSLLGVTVSHTQIAIAADYVVQDDPSASEDVYEPCAGSPDGFLEYACHEKGARFNSNATTFEAHVYVEGGVVAGASTVKIDGGKISESCMIAGPGSVLTQDDVWQPTTNEKNVSVLHGECDGTLHYNGKGDLVNITLPQSSIDNGCVAGQIPPGAKAVFNGEVIQNANIPDGMSYGENSTIIYLPSGWAICTASPCPGTVTYKYTY